VRNRLQREASAASDSQRLREEREKGFTLHFRSQETSSAQKPSAPPISDNASNCRQRRVWRKHSTEVKLSSQGAPSRHRRTTPLTHRTSRDGIDAAGSTSGVSRHVSSVNNEETTADTIREVLSASAETQVEVAHDSDSSSASYASDFESLDDDGDGSDGSGYSSISCSGGSSGRIIDNGMASKSKNSEVLVHPGLSSNNAVDFRLPHDCANENSCLASPNRGAKSKNLGASASISNDPLKLKDSNDELGSTRWLSGNMLISSSGFTASSARRSTPIPDHESVSSREGHDLQSQVEPDVDLSLKPKLPSPLELPPPPPAAAAAVFVPMPPLSSPPPLTPHSPPRRQAPGLPQQIISSEMRSPPQAEAFEPHCIMNGSSVAAEENEEQAPKVNHVRRRPRSRWRVEEARVSLAQRVWIGNNDDSMSVTCENSDLDGIVMGTADSAATLEETEWALHSKPVERSSDTASDDDDDGASFEDVEDVVWEEDVEFNNELPETFTEHDLL